jgi:hypothetical protein
LDKEPVGTSYVLKVPFRLSGQEQGTGNFGTIEDNQLNYLKNLSANQHLQYLSLSGFGNTADDYDIRVENEKTGAAVRITCDQPLTKLAFWSTPITLCPEPYIHIKVDPGEEMEWKIFYEFYTVEKNN